LYEKNNCPGKPRHLKIETANMNFQQILRNFQVVGIKIDLDWLVKRRKEKILIGSKPLVLTNQNKYYLFYTLSVYRLDQAIASKKDRYLLDWDIKPTLACKKDLYVPLWKKFSVLEEPALEYRLVRIGGVEELFELTHKAWKFSFISKVNHKFFKRRLIARFQCKRLRHYI
jgi:hypothetical protein